MKKIAIISDIHGNVPALHAVLEDIKKKDIHSIYCLGDLIGKGPSGDVVIDLVKANCEKVVQGNWDEFITNDTQDEVLKWHQAKLGADRLHYLKSLPFSIEFFMSGRYVRLFHASSRSLYERIQPWDTFDRRLSLFDSSEYCLDSRVADVVGYGDIHNAYLQNINGKTLFNVGSVGNPLDMTQASYVIVEGDYGSKALSPFNIQFIRVPYDIELAIEQAREENMPLLTEYSNELRTAIYRGKKL